MNPKCYKSANLDLGKLGDQAQLLGSQNGMSPFLHLELGVNVIGMAPDRVQRQIQFGGDFLMGFALGNQSQHLHLARRERNGKTVFQVSGGLPYAAPLEIVLRLSLSLGGFENSFRSLMLL
jgi:hypothetical protein